MNYTKSSPKRIEKVSSDNGVIGYDLLSILTYMSVLATGGLTREQILIHCSRQRLKTAIFFESVYAMAKYMGAEYTSAFQMVAERARASRIKSLLLRFAAAISSGESEAEFIDQETRAESERYTNEYENAVEGLKKWTDAYAAILVSVTLIMVVSLVSTMMGNLGEKFIMLMGLTLFCITTIGVYVIYKVAPTEATTYSNAEGMPVHRKLARLSLFILAPVGLISGMLLAPKFDLLTGSGVFFLCVGVSLIPAGVFAWLDDLNVSKLDDMLPTFVRSVGNVAGAANIDIWGALSRIGTKSMGHLEPHINNLRARLRANLPNDQCWESFRKETGSDLVNRCSHMLVDGMRFGGKADVVGARCYEFSQNIVQSRAKRRLTSATFSFLTLPLHSTMVFVLVFVLQIVATFNTELTDAYAATGYGSQQSVEFIGSNVDIPEGLAISRPDELIADIGLFAVQDLTMVTFTVVMVVITLTVANALAAMFAAGGSGLKIATCFSPLCLLSGGILIGVPLLAPVIFAS